MGAATGAAASSFVASQATPPVTLEEFFRQICVVMTQVDPCAAGAGFSYFQKAAFELPLISSTFSGAVLAAVGGLEPRARYPMLAAFALIGLAATAGVAHYALEGIFAEGSDVAAQLSLAAAAHRQLTVMARAGMSLLGFGAVHTFDTGLTRGLQRHSSAVGLAVAACVVAGLVNADLRVLVMAPGGVFLAACGTASPWVVASVAALVGSELLKVPAVFDAAAHGLAPEDAVHVCTAFGFMFLIIAIAQVTRESPEESSKGKKKGE